MRVIWIKRVALTAMAATALALPGAEALRAQFAPFSQPSQAEQPSYGYSSEPQPAYGYTNQAQQTPVYLAQQTPAYEAQQKPAYQAQQTPAYQAQQAPSYANQQSYQTQQTVPAYNAQQSTPNYSAQQQAQPRYAGYSAPPQTGYSAQPQTGNSAEPQADYSAQPQPAQQPQYMAMSYAAMDHHAESTSPMIESDPDPAPESAASTGYPTGDCPTGNCQAATPSYQGGYMGCDSGCYNSYNTFGAGCGFGYGVVQGRGCGYNCLDGSRGCCNRPRWFGGIYGLVMERDRGPYVPLSFSTPDPNAYGYYPADGETNLLLTDADIGYQGGLEIRLGMYCGGNSCDPCGCGSCGPKCGIEGVYWGLFEQDGTAYVEDTAIDGYRLYGMPDFRGLEADMGTGYRPVNDYFDRAPPTEDHTTPTDIQVRRFMVRDSFRMQNAEINLLRLPTLCGGCGAYSGGCGVGNCGGSMPRYALTSVIGARFVRIDNDFWFRSDYEEDPNGASNLGWIAYNAQTDNTLYGAQIGCNGIYRLGSSGCFALHCTSLVGLYGNHIEVTQWMDTAPGGNVRYVNNGSDDFYVTAEKDDVSVLGEFRLGASYEYSCNWRVYAGWRVVGITGVALPTDQVFSEFSSVNQSAWVHSNGSVLVHGLQAGVEYNY